MGKPGDIIECPMCNGEGEMAEPIITRKGYGDYMCPLCRGVKQIVQTAPEIVNTQNGTDGTDKNNS